MWRLLVARRVELRVSFRVRSVRGQWPQSQKGYGDIVSILSSHLEVSQIEKRIKENRRETAYALHVLIQNTA